MPQHVGAVQLKGAQEARETVGVVRQSEVLRGVVRTAATGGVPRNDGELVGQTLQLPAPHPRVTDAAVEKDQRWPITCSLKSDRQSLNLDGFLFHCWLPRSRCCVSPR
jgi:hypothetical protein